MQQTATIYSDYIQFLDTELPHNRFIYIIDPSKQEDLELQTKMLQNITKIVEKNQESQDAKFDTMQKSHEKLKKELKEDIKGVNTKIDKLIAIFEEVQASKQKVSN